MFYVDSFSCYILIGMGRWDIIWEWNNVKRNDNKSYVLHWFALILYSHWNGTMGRSIEIKQCQGKEKYYLKRDYVFLYEYETIDISGIIDYVIWLEKSIYIANAWNHFSINWVTSKLYSHLNNILLVMHLIHPVIFSCHTSLNWASCVLRLQEYLGV